MTGNHSSGLICFNYCIFQLFFIFIDQREFQIFDKQINTQFSFFRILLVVQIFNHAFFVLEQLQIAKKDFSSQNNYKKYHYCLGLAPILVKMRQRWYPSTFNVFLHTCIFYILILLSFCLIQSILGAFLFKTLIL